VTSRNYGFLVGGWVLAAIVASGWALSQSPAVVEPKTEALPELGQGPRAAATFETEDTLPSALASVTVEPVQGRWKGPGGRDFHVAVRSRSAGSYLYRQFGQEAFYLGLRLSEPEVTHEPCGSCHEGQGIVDGREGTESQSVHQNIQPAHPEQTGAQCLTCHASADVGLLRLEGGGTTEIDHAYRLCAQCHFQQVDSWAYGAHGKRLVGWRGRRVVMTCADCHDPHRPATERRPPMAGLTLPGGLSVGEGEEAGGSGQGGQRHD
jgi:hypothetical protein